MLKKKSLTQLSRGQEIGRPKLDDQIKKTVRPMIGSFMHLTQSKSKMQ